MIELLRGAQYAIMQGDELVFDGVYKGFIHDQYLFDGGYGCLFWIQPKNVHVYTFEQGPPLPTP